MGGCGTTRGDDETSRERYEHVRVGAVPVGKVRFYDADKGFGFLTKDEGGDVYVRSSALPDGVTSLKTGEALVGIELITIEARVVVASVETYLKYAEAVGLTASAAAPA